MRTELKSTLDEVSETILLLQNLRYDLERIAHAKVLKALNARISRLYALKCRLASDAHAIEGIVVPS